MKEGDATLQAKVWVKLAKIFNEPVEQHLAYNKAIEIMNKEESVEVVEILIDYAEWLHRNEYPTLDVEDQLLLAVDVLLDIEPGWDDGDDDEKEEDRTKTKSRKSRGSRASRVSKAKSRLSKVSRKTGKSVRKSVAGRSSMSRASKRTAMSRTTTRTKKTTTALSKRENEDPTPMFLNISHFDKLFRIHSMLTYISYDQKEIALDAQFFIIKMWELTYKTLNAMNFLDKHKNEAEKLGFNDQDPEARSNFYTEVFTNPEIELPKSFDLPDTPENWISFEPHEELVKMCQSHEDKTMIAKWAFQKPEITLYHLSQVLDILESHYLHIQMIPILKFAKMFTELVIENEFYSNIFDVRMVRITYSFGTIRTNDNISKKIQRLALTEAMKQKLIQENSVGGTATKEDMKSKEVSFPETEKKDPLGIDKVKTHEVWKEAAKELIKFGEYLQAKDLIMESMFHARLLKEQNNYSECLHLLSKIAELEGKKSSAIKLGMYCLNYAKDIKLICKTVSTSLRHWIALENNEADILMGKALDHFKQIRSQIDDKMIVPEVSFCLQHVYLDYAEWEAIQLDKIGENIEDKFNKLGEVTKYIDNYETLVHQSGTRIDHVTKTIEISRILYNCLLKNNSFSEDSIDYMESRLEKGTKLLLKAQEHISSQISLIPNNPTSPSSRTISHPLKRLFGVIKLRLAQANCEIGVFRNSLKTQISVEGTENKRVVDQFLEQITKQIDAQNKTVKVDLSIYEKSIILLNNALNILDPRCDESLECIVEIARCRRLLALDKKHIRSVWRQDAEDINNALNQSLIDEAKDPDEDFEDINANYKEEAVKSFIEIFTNQEMMTRIVTHFDLKRQNLLAKLSIEYAECKGNTNKEQ